MKEKIEDTELTEVQKYNSEVTVKSDVKEEHTITFRERLRRLVNLFTVEPYLLGCVFPMAIASLAMYHMKLEKACRIDLHYNETVCKDAILAKNNYNITTEARSAAINSVIEMTAWQIPLQSGIPAIVILFVGAWSDRTGNRKALMLIPLIGQIVSVSGMLLATYYFLEWPLWVTACIESIPMALFGDLSFALMGSYSYIADVTTVETRTFRVGIMTVIVTLGNVVGLSVSGTLVEAVGYYGVFSIQLALYIIAFIYTYFRIHNIRNDATEGTFVYKLCSFFNPLNVWDTISLVIVTPLKQRIRVILVLCVYVLIWGPVVGELSVSQSYVLDRYSMDPVEISLFSAYYPLMGTAGTAVAVTLFSKYFKMHDTIIGVIATACKTVSSLVFGLAPTKEWYFSGPVFDFFGNSGVMAIRSIGTKVVDPVKVGKMCSLIGLVEALIPVVYVPLYAKVYNLTSTTVPGCIYFLGSAMTIPAFFVFMLLYRFHKKDERDAVKDPNAKESQAYDNDVTSV